jgi:uncharacterized protein YyaL (SSP411 family)
MSKFQSAVIRAKYYGSFLNADLAKVYLSIPSKTTVSTEDHLKAAVQWICNAQDAFNDGGVARSYTMIHHPFFERAGWIPSYPETTGYIIPTLFDYAKQTGRQDLYDRAVRMADWECRVQMKNGAVQGGTVNSGQPPTPAIFNTGQVIFGWVRAFQETGHSTYLKAAERAGRFLVQQQDTDGAWRKSLSNYASGQMSFYSYNTRTAWALLELSLATGDQEFKERAVRNIEFALAQQIENGWFRSNCLTDPSQPLLHTISYCIRGIMETGVLLKREDYISRARKAADAVLACKRPDGSLAGRFNERWEPTVSWRCLTGEAQIAGIWGRLYGITGEKKYLEGMKETNGALKRVQLLHVKHPGLFGGITGSYPIHGLYGRFEVLNWAVKFFIDSLMLERSLTGEK